MKDTTEVTEPKRDIDSVLHSAIGRVTAGLSPAALSVAALDWGLHLAGSPTRKGELAERAMLNVINFWNVPPAEETDDNRFRGSAWAEPPFNFYRHWFSLTEDWWQQATAPIEGVDPAHQRMVAFMARQALDMMSPANTPMTNPDVLSRTWKTGGTNLLKGLSNWIEDFNHLVTQKARTDPEFQVGKTLATTPGDVVLRNRLIELIRYRPTTPKVRAEPILIVPAWIMKYYVLDLTQQNSFVAWLRDQGFEVYIISWKNPGEEDADLGLEDYLNLGVRAALDHIAPHPDDRVHGVGYCLGGTLLAAGAAALARSGDARLSTLSLLAAQVDFSEAGELSLFINESQVAFLEDMMATQGYLRADQMAGAFRMLRSNDLIWSRVIRHYLLGERTPSNALMAWNADATRMPARMHSEYLRQMFLENRLARGRFRVDNRHVALTDINVPIFALGTEKDHVSPWTSVYKINLLTDTDVTFCLTAGGHNGGILSEPGHPHREFRLGLKCEGKHYVSAEDWLADNAPKEGSWWPAWGDWLKDHGGGERTAKVKPPRSICAAPGEYVFG